jgi:hypothetical protein
VNNARHGTSKSKWVIKINAVNVVIFIRRYGESHCPSVGCIVDGCPPGMELTEADIQPQLSRRRPGQSALTTPVSFSCAKSKQVVVIDADHVSEK